MLLVNFSEAVNSNWLLVKHEARSIRGPRNTEHPEYGAVEKRKSFIINCLLLQIFLIILYKDFFRFHVEEVRKIIGLLKNTYDAKLPKTIVVAIFH